MFFFFIEKLNMLITSTSHFPSLYSPAFVYKSSRVTFSICHVKMVLIWTSLQYFIVWERVNPFPSKPRFYPVLSTSLLKTLGEKEKLLEQAISSFPTVFSTDLENFLPFSSNLKLSSANSFSLEES